MRRFDVAIVAVGLVFGAAGCSFSSPGAQGSADGTDTAGDDGGADAGGDGSDGDGDGDGDDDGGAGPWDEGETIPGSPQVPGDPAAGYEALVTKGYVSCGIPAPMFGLARPFLGAFADGEPLPGRSGPNADIPYNWTIHTAQSGAQIASFNCLNCHAGRFNGELMVGLGAADADFTGDFSNALTALPSPKIPIPGLDELTRFINRYRALGPRTQMNTVGQNPADMVMVILASHRDRDTLQWSNEPLEPIPNVIAPVDVPPWWRAHKKTAMFWNGMARGDHRGSMMLASSLCTDTVEEVAEVLTYFNDIRAYIDSLRAPPYPFEIDQDLADEGAAVFARDCAGCHGQYAADDANETYPNLIFPLHVIGTDPFLATYAVDLSPYFIGWFNDSVYGENTSMVTDDPLVGYVAPPLDGIWATAPFFHNGSVPTIEAVLDSSRRPTVWRRIDFDSRNFDQRALGWPFAELQVPRSAAPAAEQKFIYDTTLLAHGNGGHTFGDHLSDGERAAVLEYLKTL